jgi:predicted metal-dependent hydrolase
LGVIHQDFFQEGKTRVPYKIIVERRGNIRASIATKQAYLRLPPYITSARIRKEHVKFLDWIRIQIHANPAIRKRFTLKKYYSGQSINVMDHAFQLELIFDSQIKQNKAKLYHKDGLVQIKLLSQDHVLATPRLLSRTFGHHFLPAVINRVENLNQQHFNFEYNNVRLKYNKSNWGSCSTKKNINLSTRLLLAPNFIRDYVIIHELAHLKEMNHSNPFWKLVQEVMPDYKQAEFWLKENSQIDF